MPRAPSYSEAEVRAAVADARSLGDALRALGLRTAGGNYATLRRLIARYEISTDHLDPNWSRRGRPIPRTRVPIGDVLIRRSSYGRTNLKHRLYEEGLKLPICELCGQGEAWHGRVMSLVLDHINGVHDDNRLENLRIVCPNCNATLDTHCGKLNRNGPRECLACGRTFRPRLTSQQYCSQLCGARHPGSRAPKPETRKVPRPGYGELLAELEASGYSAVARRHGVSDNAVRKWVAAYEFQARQAEGAAAPADSGAVGEAAPD